jgi:hypothetical protein
LGAKGKEGYGSIFGGETAGSTGGGGGGAGGLTLGLPAMKSVFGEKAAETGASSQAGGSGLGSAGMWGATVVGAGSGLYDVYHSGKGNQSRSDLNRAVERNTGEDLVDWGIVPGKPAKEGIKKQGADYFTKFGETKRAMGLGLTQDQPDRMSAIERRYSSAPNATASITEAQDALKDSGLPDADRRSIWQKLELARVKEAKRGSNYA